jgi:hypothetical protein
MISTSASYMILREFPRVRMVSNRGSFHIMHKLGGGSEMMEGAHGYVMIGATAIFYRQI